VDPIFWTKKTKAYDYLPFDEEISAFYPTTSGALDVKFTGHAKDAETGLDFMQARHYSGAQGRFHQPGCSLRGPDGGRQAELEPLRLW
jgi:RHS repeat-associated protein